MARYVAPVADGAGGFPVIRIDDLGLERGGTVLMKLDVEGGEGPIVRGAVETLADAACFAVSVEHHPQQVDRVGVDTVETLRLVNEIRPCHFRIVERPEMTVDLDRKLGPQLGETGVFNVFCRSVER